MPVLSELKAGPDQVHFLGDEVKVFAPRAMPDWTAREFCRLPIFFQDLKYQL